MAEIFVSYSRSDSEFVDKLIGELDSKGMKVWIDRDDIEGGEKWRAAIVQAISQCRAFLLVLSPNSANSKSVSRELSLAESKERLIIPVIYQSCDIPDGMEYQLAELQRIDFTQSYEEALRRLIRVLTRATEQIARQQLQPTVPDKAAPESIPVDNERTQNANTVNSSESQRAAEWAEAPRKISPKPERPSPVITNVSSEIIITERRVAQVNTSSWLPETLVVSRDSRRVAWVTTVSGFLGIVSKYSVIVDGVERKPYANVTKTTIFSPDSQRVAYGAQVGEKWIVVVDGEEGKVCSDISDGTPIFSPDSQRVAYGAQVGEKWMAVVDGEEGKAYSGIGTLIFSLDGQRVAYTAREGEKWMVVVDGEEGKAYSGFGEGTLIFSPDSQRVAYAAREGEKWMAVVDGEEGKAYSGFGEGTPIFSPDSQRVAYAFQVGEKWMVVVDGVEGKAYSGTGTPIFSPDSQRVAYEAQLGEKWIVVVDGVEGKGYDGFLRGSQITFDSSERFHSLVMNGNDILLLTARIK